MRKDDYRAPYLYFCLCGREDFRNILEVNRAGGTVSYLNPCVTFTAAAGVLSVEDGEE